MPSFFRKVIKITGTDSPNVAYALKEIERGLEPSGYQVIPGVLPYGEYLHRLATWDVERLCVGIHAMFYEGPGNLLFPPDWLDKAHVVADRLAGTHRKAMAIGIDPGEGVANTSMAAIDNLGLIEMHSKKTRDTAEIGDLAESFMIRHQVPANRVCFDAGGGGKQHADYMRRKGYGVRVVAFNDSVRLDLKRGLIPLEVKKEMREEHSIHKNRRSEMYWALHMLLDPSTNPAGFGIPRQYTNLRDELAPVPLDWWEGQLDLPPKDRRSGQEESRNNSRKTIKELVGHSPDESDALCIAIFCLQHKAQQVVAGAI